MLRFIVTATAIITSSSAIYFYIFHTQLSKRIAHTTHNGTLQKTSNIESIPDPIFTPEFFTIHESATKSTPRATLPQDHDPAILFTRLLRRNMTAFSRFPQALMLALVSKTPEQKASFTRAHIAALDFEVGDLVCGVYRVKLRRRDRVEFEIKMQGVDYVEGRLVLSFAERVEGDLEQIVFCSETCMWKRADETRKMPLERWAVRWMHETAAWWLVESGVKYLVDLE